MLIFKKVEISDKEWVDEILKKSDCPSLEYNFTTLFIWQKIYNIEIARKNDWLFVKSGKKKQSFLFPVGSGDAGEALNELEEYSRQNNMAMDFYSLSKKGCEFLENQYPGRYTFTEKRDTFDYVYTSESLATLSGKKLSSKRNHINRFIENNPDWVYEEIDSSNIAEAATMHSLWCDKAECDSDESLAEETCAVKRAFKYYSELGLSGGILRTDGKVVAFTMGDELNESTFLVHIEKAYAEVQGAYPMINKQFVINNCQGYDYINREDDTGDEGLRKAKLSYRPVMLVEKYTAEE